MQPDASCSAHLIIGRITAPHGLKGDMRVQSLSDHPDRFLDLEGCWLLSGSGQVIRPVRVHDVRLQSGSGVLLRLEGYADRSAAETLRGCLLAVERSQAIRLEPDRWFICDLIGCAVYDEADGWLGQVREVLQHAAQDVYVIARPGEPDLLFPALKAILRRVDIAARRIDVRLPEGLFEVYRERRD